MRFSFYLLILIALSLVGCRDDSLVQNISAKQSVEILVTLRKHGIAASRQERESGKDTRYDVFVSVEDYGKALEILHEYNLPQEATASLIEVTKQRGFVPNSPEIMALRLDHALALEAERLILGLQGVVDVKVLVRSQLDGGRNWKEAMAAEVHGATASVVVRFAKHKDFNRENLTQEIRSIVAKTVPGISPAAIEVVSSELQVTDMSEIDSALNLHRMHGLSFHVPDSERRSAYRSIFALVISSIVIGAFFTLAIFLWMNRGRKRELERIRRKSAGFQSRGLLGDESAGNELIDQSLK